MRNGSEFHWKQSLRKDSNANGLHGRGSQGAEERVVERFEDQITWPDSWEICMQVRKDQLEQDMEQTGSK